MLKIYAKREEELRLLPILAEFKARVIASYPIKGRTRKIQGKNAYKVVNMPPPELKGCEHCELWRSKCEENERGYCRDCGRVF